MPSAEWSAHSYSRASSFQEQCKSTAICCCVCNAGSSGEVDPGLYLLTTYTLPIVAHPCQKIVGYLQENTLLYWQATGHSPTSFLGTAKSICAKILPRPGGGLIAVALQNNRKVLWVRQLGCIYKILLLYLVNYVHSFYNNH